MAFSKRYLGIKEKPSNRDILWASDVG